MADNMPATILEALLFLWRRAAEGKDRRPLTVEEREMLDERNPGGTTSDYRFGVEIHDADGTPYVQGAWSHAMRWWFFQGRQAGIELLVGEYARQEYSEFVGLNEKLQGVLNYLESPQLHLPVFWQHVLDRYPSLADEWSASTERQPPANKASGESAAQQVEAQAPEGEWSEPMPKKVLMSRLGLKPRAFETFAKRHGLKPISRQQWQIRLDTMDSRTRGRIETGK